MANINKLADATSPRFAADAAIVFEIPTKVSNRDLRLAAAQKKDSLHRNILARLPECVLVYLEQFVGNFLATRRHYIPWPVLSFEQRMRMFVKCIHKLQNSFLTRS